LTTDAKYSPFLPRMSTGNFLLVIIYFVLLKYDVHFTCMSDWRLLLVIVKGNIFLGYYFIFLAGMFCKRFFYISLFYSFISLHKGFLVTVSVLTDTIYIFDSPTISCRCLIEMCYSLITMLLPQTPLHFFTKRYFNLLSAVSNSIVIKCCTLKQ